MTDPVSTSVIVSVAATFGGLFAGRDRGPSGFAQIFGPGGLIEASRQPTPEPPPELEPLPLPPAFTQVQGDVTGFGSETPPEFREALLAEIIRRTGPRGVVPVQGGASGRGGAGAPGRGGGGGAAGPRPMTRKEQKAEIDRILRGEPTPNVPAVIKQGPPVPKPSPRIPEGVKIGIKEKAAIAAGIIGGTIIGSGGVIRVGPPRAGQPPPGTVGPFPPEVDPGDIGPFPPPVEERRPELEEIEVTARRRTSPQAASGLPGGVFPPPVVVGQPLPPPSPPRTIPRSVLLGILPAAAFAGAGAGARSVSQQISAPTAVPRTPTPPVPQVAPGSFFAPPSRPSETRTRSCDKPARKNRKTCWEGFYREFRNSTRFTKWTKVDCRTRKIIEEN